MTTPKRSGDFTWSSLYTRGGPWVEGMDFSGINNLEHYNKWLKKYKNEVINNE